MYLIYYIADKIYKGLVSSICTCIINENYIDFMQICIIEQAKSVTLGRIMYTCIQPYTMQDVLDQTRILKGAL